MYPFSTRTDWESRQNAITQKVEALKKSGKPLFDLTESNPTRCQFSYLNESLLTPFSNVANLTYSPDSHGLTEARKSICHYYENKGIQLTPNQIFVTANTSEAYAAIFRLICNPGDAAMAAHPSYPLIDHLGQLNDVELSYYPLFFKKSKWILPVMDYSGPKALLFVNPNNPTGHFLSRLDYQSLLQVTRPDQVFIADEVFHDYSIDGDAPHFSFAGQIDRLTFTLSGISKVLGLPQMKLSWIVVSGPKDLQSEAIRRLEILNDAYLSASTPIQIALPQWMNQSGEIQTEINHRLRENHKLLQQMEFSDSRIKKLPSEGGWYACLSLPKTADEENIALQLLEEQSVLVHPGFLFDFEDPHLVISLLPEERIFSEGLDRLQGIRA